MRKKIITASGSDSGADWDAALAAPMSASVPPALGGHAPRPGAGAPVPAVLAQPAAGLAQVRPHHGRRQAPRRRTRPWPAASASRCSRRASPDAAAPQAQRMPLKVVHEDADADRDRQARRAWSCIPGAGQPDRTLLNALLAHAPALAAVPRAGIVHRLDKDTSGLLVVAKTVAAQASLVKQLADAQHAPRLPRGGAGRSAGERHDRRAGRARRARAHAHGGDAARQGRAHRTTACSSASAAPRWSNAGSRPAARTRSACTSSTSAIRWWATRPTGAARATASRFRARRCTPRSWRCVHPRTRRDGALESPLPRDMKRLLERRCANDQARLAGAARACARCHHARLRRSAADEPAAARSCARCVPGRARAGCSRCTASRVVDLDANTRPGGRCGSHAQARTRVRGARRPIACRCCSPTRPARRWRRRTPAGAGWPRGVIESDGARDGRAAAQVVAWLGPAIGPRRLRSGRRRARGVRGLSAGVLRADAPGALAARPLRGGARAPAARRRERRSTAAASAPTPIRERFFSYRRERNSRSAWARCIWLAA